MKMFYLMYTLKKNQLEKILLINIIDTIFEGSTNNRATIDPNENPASIADMFCSECEFSRVALVRC